MRRQQLRAFLTAARYDPLGIIGDVELARQALRHDAIQKTTELVPLIAYLRRHKLRRVLEIGTERGGTLLVWTRLAERHATIVTVDWEQTARQVLTEPDELRSLAQPQQRIKVVRGDSHADETHAKISALLDGPLDLLFLDGDHTYDGVRVDFESYGSLVRPGGLIVLHDVTRHRADSRCEVERFWRQIRGRYRWREFIDPEGDMGFGPWGGIGVLHIPLKAA
jgi:predicted O-methyltransferase YrrM